MKQRILLLIALATAFGSCSVYKSGQTPDDVYYSPTKEVPAMVNTESEPTKKNMNEYLSEENYLRMKSSNRSRWSAFDDDFAYWNNPTWNNQVYFNGFYSPGYYNPWMSSGWGWGIGYNNYWGWSTGISYTTGYWNPFCPGYYGSPIIVINPKTVNTRAYAPRGTNLSTYTTSNNLYTNPKTGEKYYNISSSGSSSTLRTYRSSGGSYYVPSSGSSRYNSSGSPSRSFGSGGSSAPSYRSGGSSSGSSSGGTRSSGGSSGGSAPVRSFPRGGGK